MTDTKADDLSLPARIPIAVRALAPVTGVWTALMLTPLPLATGEALFALASVVVPVLVASLTLGPGSAHRWARERGAEFEPHVLPHLSRHLVRTRVARTLGVTLGVGVSLMLLARYNADPESFSWYIEYWPGGIELWLSALGYVLATVMTELTKPRSDDAGPAGESDDTVSAPRAAILARRRLTDHLDPFIVWALTLAAGASLVVTGVGALVLAVGHRGWWISGARPHTAMLAVVGVIALSAALAIASRRQPMPDLVALAYEELTRTATVNALAGTAASMFLIYSSEVIRLVIGSTPPVVPGILGLVAFLLGLSLWISSGTSLVFRSRRLDRIRGGN